VHSLRAAAPARQDQPGKTSPAGPARQGAAAPGVSCFLLHLATGKVWTSASGGGCSSHSGVELPCEEGHYMRLTCGLGPILKIIAISMVIGVGLGLYLGAYVITI
jgi:hypothetical protein